MTLTYADITYSGVFCRMQDEAGTEVMTGDSERTACAIAAKVSVGEYHSEVFVGG